MLNNRSLHILAVSLPAVFIVLLMFFSSIGTGVAQGTTVSNNSTSPAAGAGNLPLVPVPVQAGSITLNFSGVYQGNAKVMVTFNMSNPAGLSTFLLNVENPSNPMYRHYITAQQFASDFSISSYVYNLAASYFSSYKGLSVKTYPDRVSILVTGKAATLDQAFHTELVRTAGGFYHASGQPMLPENIAGSVSQISGLTDTPIHVNTQIGHATASSSENTQLSTNGYPQPVVYLNNQYDFGSNFQVAYQENPLFGITYPTNEVIATILWSGFNFSGQSVGPFYPKDIYAYYNASLPAGEPHPIIHAVPLNGALLPGISSTYDISGASLENTLDLEMAGSTAPGSNIYNVYSPTPTFINLDSEFAFVLNPNSSYQMLSHVSVISNSWGGYDHKDTAFMIYMQEAAARGITVLASSGDSADSSNSSFFLGGSDQQWFPSTMAYNTFGVTSVGGTNVTLTPDLHIQNQTGWYMSPEYTGDGPIGSTGGISTVYTEPVWQRLSPANSLIQNKGRGTPDIAGTANHTLIYLTVFGFSYYNDPFFYYAWGTSVASPLYAGIVAEMNAVLSHFGKGDLGYLNPLIYRLADIQFASTYTNSHNGYGPFQYRGQHGLFFNPFDTVIYGHNVLYSDQFGYDLVTGWGSLNALNFTLDAALTVSDANHLQPMYRTT